MDYKPEIELENYPKWVSLETTEEIIKQMKTKICKIYLKNGIKATGFFCKISLPNNQINVLITNNHIINKTIIEEKEIITISINNEFKKLKLNNRIIYTDKQYDITIIEIKKEDKIKCDYFEYEQNDFIEKNIKESIYILHYPGDENVSVSYGIINNIKDEYEFIHYCSTDNGSSGSPIINLKNKKIIGIHKRTIDNYNLGTFLNFPINIFIKQNYIDNNIIEFNKIFNMNIKYNIKILDLSKKKDKCWEYLINLELNELKELDLSYNNIRDISFLEKVKFEKLEKLNLGGNKNISNYNILKNVNFKELKELDLSNNDISDISFLEKLKFEKLEKLNLSGNENISNYNILKNVNFKELKELNLSDNNLSDISFLEKVKFKIIL